MAVPRLLLQHGVDAGKLLADFGLTLTDFDEPEHTIPFATMGALLGRCAAQTGCPHFGLMVGELTGASALGAVGFLIQSAPDVRFALGVLASRIHLNNPGVAMSLVEGKDFATLRYDIVQPGIESHEQILDGAMAIARNIMQSLCGPDWRPAQVRLAHGRPDDVAELRRVFQADLYFDAAETALVFSRSCLDKVPLTADPVLHKMMAHRVSELTLSAGEDVVGQLRRLLPWLLATRNASLTAAAKAVGLSARTLSRRLADAETSFMGLRDDVCFAIASQLLASTRIPVGEVATLLGYANLSAFTRAFTRWSGVGPAQWRAARGKRSGKRTGSGGRD